MQDLPTTPVPANKLFIDYDYHRAFPQIELDRAYAEIKAAEEANPGYVEPEQLAALLVTPRSNGRYSVIDGAFRFLLGKMRGRASFACAVVQVSSREEEAALYMRMNTNPPKEPIV